VSGNYPIKYFYTLFISDFGRYASQTEHSMDDLTVKKPIIPPLMSLSITPPPSSPVMTNNTQQSFIMPTSVTKEKYDFR
jgi:hypothetical protein